MSELGLPSGSLLRQTQEYGLPGGAPATIRVLISDTNQLNSKLLMRELQCDSNLRIETCRGETNHCIDSLSTSIADVLLWVGSAQCAPSAMIDGIPELLRSFPSLRMILVVEALGEHHVVQAFRAGAHGLFSVERGSIKGLLKCISSVWAGQIWANNAQTLCLIEAVRTSPVISVRCARGTELLTCKQLQTVGLVAEGMGNREISQRLGVSENTVKKSIYRIFEKLGVSNRVELVLYALAGELSSVRDQSVVMQG